MGKKPGQSRRATCQMTRQPWLWVKGKVGWVEVLLISCVVSERFSRVRGNLLARVAYQRNSMSSRNRLVMYPCSACHLLAASHEKHDLGIKIIIGFTAHRLGFPCCWRSTKKYCQGHFGSLEKREFDWAWVKEVLGKNMKLELHKLQNKVIV